MKVKQKQKTPKKNNKSMKLNRQGQARTKIRRKKAKKNVLHINNDSCESHNVPSTVAASWWDKIDKKYSEPHRFYHNQGMLAQKAEFLCSGVDSAIVFATIFQYYEFDVKVNSVEANCEAFQQFLADAAIEDEKLKNSVLKLLGDDTVVEGLELSEATFEYFQDMDLAILGSPPDQYAEYVKLLQDEHEQIGLPVYRNMRLKILQTFLTIPHIYMNQSFRDRFEAVARENIKREIEDLKAHH